MKFNEYLADLPRGEAKLLAKRLKKSPSFVSQVASGTAPASPILCCAIERETHKRVMRWDLRPNDWYLIWPELIGTEGAPGYLEVDHAE